MTLRNYSKFQSKYKRMSAGTHCISVTLDERMLNCSITDG